jgi:hypothetical protein
VSGELVVAALAIVASTATAIISMLFTGRSQRQAIREQYLWKERTDTYLKLQDWIHEIYDWSDENVREAPPWLDRDTELRVSLFSSPFVHHHFVGMKEAIIAAAKAARDEEWNEFRDLQLQLSVGFAVDLSSLLRDEIRGRTNEDVATPRDEIRLRWRKRQALRWFVLKHRFQHKRKEKVGMRPDVEIPPSGVSYEPGDVP